MATPTLLHNQVAVVTGAGQGIGFEICRQLCAHGAKVVLNDLDETLATKAVKAITEEQGTCTALPGDSSDATIIAALIKTAVDKYGRLDIVIANAGITLFGGFLEYPATAFDQVMKVNLNGSFFLAQAAAKQFIQQGHGGSILLTSSVTGHQAHKNLAAYGMSKAALEMLAKNLVIELSPYKIRINTIAPGATLTERTLSDKEYEKTWSDITPLGCPATSADIANAAIFLVSPLAKHITGQSLIIDGGWTSVSPSP
ncbi:SDR family NAD(P)-dependent oxidoreductase [Flavihumibacter fluvii]|uniref:SDR family NAD(P)-dependent oxidoreductase n=1 Tax=Flavihumibacter fluvii TaxID=2838157 RepID=UPI001BDF52F3|nr:glucose 1-dehydrogenase [Flavihumibacter fluvii]ULQ51396.1 glucose 1-dehydrogenase [Flavihumibacter fluvii]